MNGRATPKEGTPPAGADSLPPPGTPACSGEPPGLYLHIPFCRTKCPYCAFFSVTDRKQVPAFLAALAQEMALHRGAWPAFDTLYLGGGTPSALPPDALEEILAAVRTHFPLRPDAEITLEVNPGDLEGLDLRRVRGWGVGRLQVGVQSLDNGHLRFLGRRHTARQGRDMVSRAAAAGFPQIGLDLLYGLPGQERRAWQRDLETVASFPVTHLSCYQLTVEDGTPFRDAVQRGALCLPDEETQRAFFLETAEILEGEGFLQYEVSNFARGEDAVSRHNSKYWRHVPYLGLGPSAHSFDGLRRWWNGPDLEGYLHRLQAGCSPQGGEEVLTPEQRKLETLFLGLRTRRGVDLGGYRDRFGMDLLREKQRQLEPLLAEGFVSVRHGFLCPTRKGLAVADSLALL